MTELEKALTEVAARLRDGRINPIDFDMNYWPKPDNGLRDSKCGCCGFHTAQVLERQLTYNEEHAASALFWPNSTNWAWGADPGAAAMAIDRYLAGDAPWEK